MRSCSIAGSAAEPDTSRRAPPNACASCSSPSHSLASRWYIVGTANSIVAPSCSAAAAACGEKRPRWWTPPPSRSGPRLPRISPCTWNSGRPWATTSSAVHSQACGERVEVGGDRAQGQHRALRRAGRARGVHDDRRVLVARSARQVAAARSEVDGDRLGNRRVEARRHQHQLRLAVGQDVAELALARLRVDRDDRHARGQRPGDARDHLRLVHGPDGDAAGSAHALGDGRGGVAQLGVAHPAVAEAQCGRDRAARAAPGRARRAIYGTGRSRGVRPTTAIVRAREAPPARTTA